MISVSGEITRFSATKPVVSRVLRTFLLRELNTNLVLNTIRHTDPICQVDIIKRTQLSAGTVTSIVKELREHDFVKVIGPRKSSIGRKPIPPPLRTVFKRWLNYNCIITTVPLT
ncbi:MAG: winged helix-turn-helix transcriptional regulator [Actinobacteria bacterium]|nr:winged helix-turn-helix transcriptional regulator [Actinomycetota bacterium]